jgi:prevent-host-death family protein
MGIRELRDTLTSTIRRVQRGETIEVTHHGVPVAVLGPMPAGRIARLVASGEVTAGTPQEKRRARFPVTGAISASEALAEDRAER